MDWKCFLHQQYHCFVNAFLNAVDDSIQTKETPNKIESILFIIYLFIYFK
jgi:hypothetical protein